MKRSPLKRKTALKRGKPMKKAGKKTLARKSAMKAALDAYFVANGYQNEEGDWVSVDQVTGLILYKRDAQAHHKTPESELRKLGLSVEERNRPERLIICHWAIHKYFVHDDQMGRPKTGVMTLRSGSEIHFDTEAGRRFRIIEESPAHAGNSLLVDWAPQDRADMFRFIGIRGGI